MPKPSTYHIKSCQNASQIDEKSRLHRGCVFGPFLEGFGAPKVERGTMLGVLLATIFHQKPKQWLSKSHPKIDAEKVSKFDAKRYQNDIKMDAEINDCSQLFEKGENAPDPLFSNEKRGAGHANSDQKCIKNQCKIDAGKSHAKMMKIMAK